ncbi:MAG: Hsp70 family protein [Spirochaetaceae bacterium]|jgi:molecular chaperone DnaK (HSP70)|nr:Hsp70 family protein [Spirochaetaceae bacterium]
MAKVYGIDLGTTYSVIATLDDNGMPIVIENQDEGTRTLASAVYFQEGGDPVVGEVAKSQAEVEPERVVQYVKREIGKSDAQKREFDGITYDPITISSLILKRMKEYANEQGEDVKDVVITCPAYFGNEERAATKQAGIVAGLNVLNIVNEPTAAALNYCCREFKENRKIMVYDLGGGTFDITLFNFAVDEAGKATIDIIDKGGDDRLGGIDWDARLYDYIAEQYCNENGLSTDQIDNELRVNIKNQVEGIKKLLSKKATHSFNVSYSGDTTRIEVSAEKFEELTQDLVERTMDFVRQLLSNNSLAPENIDVVLLVGGSTFMPMIKNAVEGMFHSKVRVEDPNLAVAKGAALAAAIEWNEIIDKRVRGETDQFSEINDIENTQAPTQPITEEEASKLRIGIPQQVSTFNDKLSRSFGPAVFVDESHYMIDNLLFDGDEMPSEATGQYGTMADNQAAVEFTVFENFAKDRVNKHVTPSIDENGNEQYTDPALKVKSLGNVRLELPPGTPKGTPIEVFFRCSAIGLEVRATNMTTGETVNTVITSENTMSQEELTEAVKHMATVHTSGNL